MLRLCDIIVKRGWRLAVATEGDDRFVILDADGQPIGQAKELRDAVYEAEQLTSPDAVALRALGVNTIAAAKE